MKKVLSVVLSTMMILSALSMLGTAVVADNATPVDATPVDSTPAAAVKLGDVNADGNVTVVDVKWILQEVANLREFDSLQKAAGDVNHDGKISVADAKKVLKVVAGMDTLLQVGEDGLSDEGWLDI